MTSKRSSTRVDASGKAFKGSQHQLQRYVNEFTDELDDALRRAIPDLGASAITWRSPLADDAYREYRDSDFLERVGHGQLRSALSEFWPRGGPVWDGLAQVARGTERPGVLLVEAKSYPAEMFSTCRATPASRVRIDAALAKTRRALGARGDAGAWTKSYYQLANRIAHAQWLREQGVEAWLVSLCFVDDKRHFATSAETWAVALTSAASALGLIQSPASGPIDVLLAAKDA